MVPITAQVIRKMPLGTIIREAKRHHEQNERRAAEQRGESKDEAAKWGPKRGQALTFEDLNEVADAYNHAWLSFMPVTAAVAAACNVAQSTAGKRIMAARRAGLIPPKGSAR